MRTVAVVVDRAFVRRRRCCCRHRTDTRVTVVRRAMEFVDMADSLVFVAFEWERRADCATMVVDC